MLAHALICIATGLIVGILSGLLGIGGGAILVPLFRLGFGMSAIATTATSLFTIIFTAGSGVISHVRRRTCVPKLGIAAGLGGAITAPIGTYLGRISPSWLIMSAAAAVIIFSAVTMFRKALETEKGVESETAETMDGKGKGEVLAYRGKTASAETAVETKVLGEPGESLYDDAALCMKKNLAISVATGIFAGVMSGYVGVGGGFIIIPLLVAYCHLPMKLASGTSLIAILILAIPGATSQILAGNVEILTGICVAAGSIPGAILGARLVKKIPERNLRLMFAVVLTFAALSLIANEFGILG